MKSYSNDIVNVTQVEEKLACIHDIHTTHNHRFGLIYALLAVQFIFDIFMLVKGFNLI